MRSDSNASRGAGLIYGFLNLNINFRFIFGSTGYYSCRVLRKAIFDFNYYFNFNLNNYYFLDSDESINLVPSEHLSVIY